MQKLKRIPTQQERLEATNINAIITGYESQNNVTGSNYKLERGISDLPEIGIFRIDIERLVNATNRIENVVKQSADKCEKYIVMVENEYFYAEDKEEMVLDVLIIKDIVEILKSKVDNLAQEVMKEDYVYKLQQIKELAEIVDIVRELKYCPYKYDVSMIKTRYKDFRTLLKEVIHSLQFIIDPTGRNVRDSVFLAEYNKQTILECVNIFANNSQIIVDKTNIF